jgi:CHASE3 domain sensor protein
MGFAFALACLGVVGVVSYLSVVRLNENAASDTQARQPMATVQPQQNGQQ